MLEISERIEEINDLRDSTTLPYLLLEKATLLKDIGRYDEAILLYQQCNNFWKEDQVYERAYTENGLGLVEKRLLNLDKSLNHLSAALVLYQSLENSNVTVTRNNIGLVYMKLERYDSALIIFSGVYLTSKDSMIQSMALLNIGETFRMQNRIDSAKHYFQKAYKIKKDVNDKIGLAILSNNLAQLYLHDHELTTAKKYLDEALSYSEQVQSMEELSRNHELRSIYYEKIKKSESALEYYKQHKILEDSILNVEKARSIAAMQVRFDTEQKERDLQEEKARAEVREALLEQRNITIAALLSGALLLVVLVVFVYRQYQRKKSSEEQSRLLMRELHHRVENNFTVLASILGLQANKSRSKEAKALAKEGESRLHAMNLLHKRLYWKDNMATIPMDQYIREVVEQAMSVYAIQHVKNHLELESIQLPIPLAIPLGLIVNELITNSYKHAFANHPNPVLTVSLKKKKEKVELVIGDNGPGIIHSKSKGSFGLSLIETLVKQLKANFESLNIEEGMAFKIELSVLQKTKKIHQIHSQENSIISS